MKLDHSLEGYGLAGRAPFFRWFTPAGHTTLGSTILTGSSTGMNQLEMQAAINALRDISADAIGFMQGTHASDHLTAAHTRDAASLPEVKSFYMKGGTVIEQQGGQMKRRGWETQLHWVPNMVSVPGYLPADAADEARIAKAALNMGEYMLINADDEHGGKFLMVTAIPAPYAGFSFTGANALPQQVHMNVLVIRAAGNVKLLSTYPADSGYVHSRPGATYTIA
jgi:hypothetical protein